jgi:creatinine amidohydrolase
MGARSGTGDDMSVRLWQDLTSREVAALDHDRTVALLPVAAIEQHGPHLPLGTDALINEGVIRRAIALAPAELDLVIMPPIHIGKSNEHLDFAGTLTLSGVTLINMLTEIAESVARADLRKLVLFNSHGGQPQVLDIVAQDLRARHRMVVVVANAWRMMDREKRIPAHEREAGLHGGAVETALMLHLRPDLVRMGELRDFPSSARELAAAFPLLAGGGRLAFAWQAQDLNLEGAVGDARLASAELGRQLIEDAAGALVALVSELSRLPLEMLRRAR